MTATSPGDDRLAAVTRRPAAGLRAPPVGDRSRPTLPRPTEGAPAAPPVGVLYDFDGTLTPRDTMAGFLVHCFARGGWRRALLLPWAAVSAPLWLLPGGRRPLLSVTLWLATVGRSRRAVARLVRAYAAALARDAETLLYPEARARLHAHRARGEQIWVVSGSCRLWIRAVLRAAGFPEARVVASSFAFRAGGLVMTRRCTGRVKVSRLLARAARRPLRWRAACSDGRTDLPLLSLAEHRAVVNPGPLDRLTLSPRIQRLTWDRQTSWARNVRARTMTGRRTAKQSRSTAGRSGS